MVMTFSKFYFIVRSTDNMRDRKICQPENVKLFSKAQTYFQSDNYVTYHHAAYIRHTAGLVTIPYPSLAMRGLGR